MAGPAGTRKCGDTTMTNAITTPTIESLVASIKVSDRFDVDDYGMHISGIPTLDEYMQIGYMLGKVRGALAWAVGDYLNSFEEHHGELMSQAEVMFPEKSYQYLMDCKWVSKKVAHNRRHRGSWSTWKEVLAIDQKDQNKLLKDYEEGKLANQKELRIAVRELQGIAPKENDDAYLADYIKRLKKFLGSTNTLSGAQIKLVIHAIELLEEADQWNKEQRNGTT